jgi:hypothetical protein
MPLKSIKINLKSSTFPHTNSSKRTNNNDINLIYYLENMYETERQNILINKIKTNYYPINKPQEGNMKYKLADELLNDNNSIKVPDEKITIGNIDGYKDIIEKDKCINVSNSYANFSKFPEPIIINESNDIEKDIINMITLNNVTGNNSIDSMGIFKKNIEKNRQSIKDIKTSGYSDDKNQEVYVDENEFSCISRDNDDKYFGEISSVYYKNNNNINNNNIRIINNGQNKCNIF